MNQNYRQIQNLLGGLTPSELVDLRKQLDFRIELATNHKGSRLVGEEHGYLEVKLFRKTRKNGTTAEYEYEYWRYWDGKVLRSKYIGKPGTYAKRIMPAQPRKAAA